MTDYFIQIDQLTRLLKPPIPSEELINLIVNHYTPDIRNIIVDKVSGLSTTEVIGTHSNEIVSDVFLKYIKPDKICR